MLGKFIKWSCIKYILISVLILHSVIKLNAQIIDLNNYYPTEAPSELWEITELLNTSCDTTIADSIFSEALINLQNVDNIEAQLMTLSRVGNYYMQYLRDFEKAKTLLDKAKKAYNNVSADSISFALAYYYNTRAILKSMQGHNSGRLFNFQKAFDIMQSYDNEHEAMLYFMRNLMQTHFMLRQISEGFYYSDLMRTFAKKHNNHYYIAEAYMGAGNIIKFYKPGLAALFFEHVVLLAHHYQITDLLETPFFYVSVGSGYTANGNHHEALEFYKSGLEVLNTSGTINDDNLKSALYCYIGVSHKNVRNDEMALVYLDSALTFMESRGESHMQNYFRILHLYGSTLNNAGKYADALSINKNAVNHYLKTFQGRNTYYISSGFYEVARSYKGLKKYDSALAHIQKAITYSVHIGDTIPPLLLPNIMDIKASDINYQIFEMDVYQKIDILKEMYVSSKDASLLNVIFEHFDFMMQLADLHASMAQNLSTIHQITARYKRHTNNLFDFMAQYDMPSSYWQEAYLIGARAKSYSFLRDQLQISYQDASLPDLRTNELVRQQSLINKKTQPKDFITTSSKRLLYEKERFLDKLSQPTQAEHLLIPQLSKTRQKNPHESVLDNEIILDYYVTTSYIHSFIFDNTNFEVLSIPLPPDMEDIYRNFFRGLKTANTSLLEGATKKLSEILLTHIDMGLSENIVVIPDDQLWAVPFEVLMKNGSYLVKSKALSYRYTSPIFREHRQKEESAAYDFLAYAPVFDNVLTFNKKGCRGPNPDAKTVAIYHDSGLLAELPASAAEVLNIQAMFEEKSLKSEIRLRDEAHKQSFIDEAGKARILHIATHGVSHSKKTELSGIYLSGNQKHNDFLYTSEILDMPLMADLVVLSACESGYGTILHGEGIMAISKSFLAAGADNVVASLWKIHDEKTQFFMQKFYQHLLQDTPFKEALQKAKINYINAGEMPLDWAGFILIEN